MPNTNPPVADGKTLNQNKQESRYKREGYVRVTTALEQMDKGEELKRWMISFKTYADYREALRKAAERGSIVDNIIKQIVSGVDPDTIGVEEQHTGFIKAFLTWNASANFSLLSADEEVYDDDMKYVGTLDLYGTVQHDGGKHVIIDIKTGEPTRDKEGNSVYRVYDEQKWQTAAYRHAKTKMGHRVDENWVLRLFSDGKYKYEQDIHYETSFEIFSNALRIAQLKAQLKTM